MNKRMDIIYNIHILSLVIMFVRVLGDSIGPAQNVVCSPKAEEAEIVYIKKEEQRRLIFYKYIECDHLMNASNVNITGGSHCPRIWDNIMCWPETAAGTVACQPCPSYINRFNTKEFAFRECLPNGEWYDPRGNHSLDKTGWTNFNQCISAENQTHIDPVPKSKGVISLVTRHVDAFRLMYNIGYVLSVVSLALAIFIMLYFRKLHCARNYIHLNLFLSFLLRATLSVIKDNTWEHYLGFPFDVEKLPNGTVVYTEGPHWECRSFFTLYKYVLVSSYMWIFMEAVYIHMVIFVAVFTEKTRVIWYIIVGWTLPLPFVITWAISRSILDNTYCWQLSENKVGLTWLIQAPVVITVVLNFVFFINIVRVLLTKLNTFPNSDTNRYRTLAKSIVVLIPLFGVYYILVVVPNEQVDDTTSFAILLVEMFFNSYQGLFIATLLCFTNAEVRAEIGKSWSRFSLRRMSNVSRASQMFPIQTSRSLSTTRLSDASRFTAAIKRYQNNQQITENDDEQSAPFTNPHASNTDDYTETDKNSKSETDVSSDKNIVTENGSVQNNTDKFQVKINVVNIECKSRDGLSKYTTSLNIQTLKNGRTVSAENILNNNVQETIYTVPDGDDTIHFMDDREEKSDGCL